MTNQSINRCEQVVDKIKIDPKTKQKLSNQIETYTITHCN